MNDAQKQDVMIFAEAFDLPLSERAAHLDRACAADENLRQRVASATRPANLPP